MVAEEDGFSLRGRPSLALVPFYSVLDIAFGYDMSESCEIGDVWWYGQFEPC